MTCFEVLGTENHEGEGLRKIFFGWKHNSMLWQFSSISSVPRHSEVWKTSWLGDVEILFLEFCSCKQLLLFCLQKAWRRQFWNMKNFLTKLQMFHHVPIYRMLCASNTCSRMLWIFRFFSEFAHKSSLQKTSKNENLQKKIFFCIILEQVLTFD